MGNTVRFGCIFDLDGVLIDSTAAHYQAWKSVCGELGRELSMASFLATVGSGNAYTVRLLFGQVRPEIAAELAMRKEELYRRDAAQLVTINAGVGPLIRSLAESGWRLALGTSAPAANVEAVIDRIPNAELLSVRICEEMVAKSKPDPEVFLRAASLLGLPPSACVVVEDSLNGLEAARSAGMAAIGLTTTMSEQQLLPLADLVVDSLERINPLTLAEVITGRTARN